MLASIAGVAGFPAKGLTFFTLLFSTYVALSISIVYVPSQAALLRRARCREDAFAGRSEFGYGSIKFLFG